MNLNFVKHHEIFLRQDIKSNYRNTAGTICPIYSLTRTNLELPKRQNVKHKSIKSTIFEIRLYSKIVQLSRVKLFINNPKTIEKSSKYIQSFYAEKFISKRGSPPRTPIFFFKCKIHRGYKVSGTFRPAEHDSAKKMGGHRDSKLGIAI